MSREGARIYRVGEEITIRRWRGRRRARIVRAGPAAPSSAEASWDTAAFVFWQERPHRWTIHPQPLYESEIEP